MPRLSEHGLKRRARSVFEPLQPAHAPQTSTTFKRPLSRLSGGPSCSGDMSTWTWFEELEHAWPGQELIRHRCCVVVASLTFAARMLALFAVQILFGTSRLLLYDLLDLRVVPCALHLGRHGEPPREDNGRKLKCNMTTLYATF